MGLEIVEGSLSALIQLVKIQKGQLFHQCFEEIRYEIVKEWREDFQIVEDSALHWNGRLCALDDADLKCQIFNDAHAAPYAYILVPPRCITI